ncbi:AraC family transcriptional regulator [Paenibacillus turpanensis]|uniref:AraC family transcriptional regulator n=1 Tax=Paenibacillus turpanensis TaxID=2689078 RepID=UPI00140BE572|nr:AraC family transcriptional regulator [Paenibacillus turpanensis]
MVIGDGEFSIHYWYYTGHAEMRAPHAHASYELFYVLDGGRVFFINGTVYTANKGDLIFINSNDVHRTTSSEALKCERVLINFTDAFLQHVISHSPFPLLPVGRSSPVFHFPINEQAAVEELLQKMLQECRLQESGYEMCVQSLLTELLIRMYRHDLKEYERQAPPAHPMHQKISEVASYMNEHFSQQVTLQETARRFFISPSYLSRTFKNVTGFQFSEYLQIIRIREAQRRLRETDEPIGRIAEEVGFDHTANFNVTFKKITGVTPGYYRRSMGS